MAMSSSSARGFTLVEIVTSIAVFAIMTLIVFAYLVPTLYQTRQNQLRTEMADSAQRAFDMMATSGKHTSSFLPVMDSEESDSYAPAGGWSYKGDGSGDRVLITQDYFTDKHLLDDRGVPVFHRVEWPEDCQSWRGEAYRTYNFLYTYNTIYFVDDNTLYRRWVARDTPDLTDCNDNNNTYLVEQTCPVDGCTHDGEFPNNSSFRAYDSILAHNVKTFTVDYYTTDNTPIVDPYDSATPEEVIRSATYAKVTLTLENSYGDVSAEYTSTVVLRRLNPYAV
jgi:prepilin-type N-terminal cleavage/methylation domain-containing protein